MNVLVERVAALADNHPWLVRLSMRSLAAAAARMGAPRLAASVGAAGRAEVDPSSCAEFCAPASNCHHGCGCGTLNCFVCNGCGDVNVLRCFSHACSGFCWKVTC